MPRQKGAEVMIIIVSEMPSISLKGDYDEYLFAQELIWCDFQFLWKEARCNDHECEEEEQREGCILLDKATGSPVKLDVGGTVGHVTYFLFLWGSWLFHHGPRVMQHDI